MRTRQRNLISGINDWIAHMYNLANRIDHFENNDLAARDLQLVPRKIERVKQRVTQVKDEHTRRDLQGQLQMLQRQLISLEASASTIKRAEIQLESTLSALGTVYAQMSLLGTKDANSAKGQRLSVEIQDEIDKLQDTIDAMDEVHFHGQNLNDNFRRAISELDTAEVEEVERIKQQRLSAAPEDEIEDMVLAANEEAQQQRNIG